MTNILKDDAINVMPDFVIYSETSKVVCDGHNRSSAHPRIYLSLEKTGRTVCPYCSCTYCLRKNL